MQPTLSFVKKMTMRRIMRMRRTMMKMERGKERETLGNCDEKEGGVRSNSSLPSKRPLFSLAWG